LALITYKTHFAKIFGGVLQLSTIEESRYYVYEYFATKPGKVVVEDSEVHVNENQVYYVGKGQGRRITTGIRNTLCEKFKGEVGWGYRTVKDSMDEADALAFEEELIQSYRNEDIFLTNKQNGNSLVSNPETISILKYLVLLNRENVIRMTQSQLVLETETYGGLVCEVSNMDFSDTTHKYYNLKPKCPDNLDYILSEYDSEMLTEREVKYGNILYVLNLHEKGLIKATQKELADYFEESTTVISGIKTGKYKSINPIKPGNLEEILRNFDTGKLNETEVKEGMVKYIIDRLIETKILNMTLRDVIRELQPYFEINENWIQDLKRRKEVIPYVKPKGEILGKLFHKYHDIAL
jgi:hypothetical protein